MSFQILGVKGLKANSYFWRIADNLIWLNMLIKAARFLIMDHGKNYYEESNLSPEYRRDLNMKLFRDPSYDVNSLKIT